MYCRTFRIGITPYSWVNGCSVLNMASTAPQQLPRLLLMLLPVWGLGLILICQGRPLFMASSHYDINTVDSGTVTYTKNSSCPPCAKDEYRLTDETAKRYPCLCSKCREGMYPDIDDSCMPCSCCNKTNKATGENMWGHKIKECDALFPDKKCDADMDFKAVCNVEPTPGSQTPPFFVRFPWMYGVILVAAVAGIVLLSVGPFKVYRRWKKRNEESLLHPVEESRDQGGGYSHERPQDVAGDSDESLLDVAGDSDESLLDDSEERPQNVAGHSNERPTDISPSVNSDDNESATLSAASNCESEQAANSLHDGPPANDTSIEDSMTNVPSKSKQDKDEDQVGVHKNHVHEDAETSSKADPWLEDELQNEDHQQDSNRSESLPQQNSVEVSFIDVNPSTDPSSESDDEFVRIAQRRPSEESGDGTYAKVGANTTFDHSDLTQTTREEEEDDNGATHCKTLAGDEATEQIVTRDESITKPGEQEAASVVKGGQQVTAVDSTRQSVESLPIQIVEAEEPEASFLSQTDSSTEQDLPGSVSSMAAFPRPADGKADGEQKPQNKETNPQTSSQDVEEENDELNMVTPSSTSSGDQAQQDMGHLLAAKTAVEEYPGAKQGLTTKPQPRITTDNRTKTTNQMSGQASGGTVRMHQSGALSQSQVKANEPDQQVQVEDNCMEDLSAVGTGGSKGNMATGDTDGSTGNLATGGTGDSLRNPAAARYRDAKDQVLDQDFVVQRCSVEEAGGDECAAGGADQVQDDDRVSTDGQGKRSHNKETSSDSEEEESSKITKK